jgi:hypothetical protein
MDRVAKPRHSAGVFTHSTRLCSGELSPSREAERRERTGLGDRRATTDGLVADQVPVDGFVAVPTVGSVVHEVPNRCR